MSKNIKTLGKRRASPVPVGATVESVTINTSSFNKPFSPSPQPSLVSITRVDKGPTAPHGDTKGMVTGPSPRRLTRITLLPEELLQALLALLSPNNVPLEEEGTYRYVYSRPCHLKLQQPGLERG